jgi:hypothetical protein
MSGNHRTKYNHDELIGEKYGKLTIIGVEREKFKTKRGVKVLKLKCSCDCGNDNYYMKPSDIVLGKVKSCGCGQSNHRSRGGKIHGMSGSKIYYLWKAMLQRCENPNNKAYRYYGAKGIKVCDRWHDFENFYTDMSTLYYSLSKKIGEKNVSLERIKVSEGYNPENCTWIHRFEQGNNKTNVTLYPYNGEMVNKSELGRRLGMCSKTIQKRFDLGWSLEKIINTPLRKNKRPKKHK